MSRIIPALAITHESAVPADLIAAIRVIASLLNDVSRNKAVVDRLPVAVIPRGVRVGDTTRCTAQHHERHRQSSDPNAASGDDFHGVLRIITP